MGLTSSKRGLDSAEQMDGDSCPFAFVSAFPIYNSSLSRSGEDGVSEQRC